MENASKALLFAAGILIAIILISVAVYIVSMGNQAVDEASGTIAGMSVKSFNQKFEVYADTQTGSQVSSLVSEVNANNANNPNAQVDLVNAQGIIDGTSPNQRFVGNKAKKYNVSIEKTAGAVSKITVSNASN